MEYFSVIKVANLLGKHEETIKRWIRAGKFPNAQKENDKLGWRIPEKDLSLLQAKQKHYSNARTSVHPQHETHIEERDLVNLAYQAVTICSPTEEMVGYLSYVGIKRTLEILLTMQQSPTKVKNPDGFIKKAITEGWTPTTLPIKKERNIARKRQNSETENQESVPFYNWLEEY